MKENHLMQPWQYGPFQPRERKKYFEPEGIRAHTDSDASDYESILGDKLEVFRGQNFLDVGGMPNGKFAKAANAAGIKLTTLNPRETHITRRIVSALRRTPPGYKVIGGFVQDMANFPENSFDIEIAHASLGYLPNFEQEWRAALSEMIRVQKPGGKTLATVIPDAIVESDLFESLVKDLEQKNNAKIAVKLFGRDFSSRWYNLEITKNKSE